jgi:hypothetical protein
MSQDTKTYNVKLFESVMKCDNNDKIIIQEYETIKTNSDECVIELKDFNPTLTSIDEKRIGTMYTPYSVICNLEYNSTKDKCNKLILHTGIIKAKNMLRKNILRNETIENYYLNITNYTDTNTNVLFNKLKELEDFVLTSIVKKDGYDEKNYLSHIKKNNTTSLESFHIKLNKKSVILEKKNNDFVKLNHYDDYSSLHKKINCNNILFSNMTLRFYVFYYKKNGYKRWSLRCVLDEMKIHN